jgi:hypothetical protein
MATNAIAVETSECELLLVQIIQSPDGKGEARVPSYIPAEEFMATLTDNEPGHMTDYLGHKIQAVMCRRDDIIPAEEDYGVFATGIPFILSQDFDSTESDSLTLYWKDEKVEHVYKGYPLSEEAETILETRLAEFSERGRVASAVKSSKSTSEIETETEATTEMTIENTSDIVVVPTNIQADTQIEDEDVSEVEPSIEIESISESEE